MPEATHLMSAMMDNGCLSAPEPIDSIEAARIRTAIFKDGVYGSMHRRSDGGWTVFGTSGHVELVPLTGSLDV